MRGMRGLQSVVAICLYASTNESARESLNSRSDPIWQFILFLSGAESRPAQSAVQSPNLDNKYSISGAACELRNAVSPSVLVCRHTWLL